MVKKLLLTPLDDDFEWYVEKTRNGNKYYMKLIGKREYMPVSKKEMQDVIRSDAEQYGFVRYYHRGRGKEERENFIRIRKLAPELLPKLVELSDSDDNSWKVIPSNDFCPPGYKFVPAEKPKKVKYGNTLRGYCKLL